MVAAQVGLACAAGCEKIDLPPLEYETETTVVGTAFDAPLCQADLAFLDERVRFAEQMLGVQAELPIEVYLYETGEVPCGGLTPFGCYNRTKRIVTSSWPDVAHELVHAVAHSISFPSKFWSEGVAVALDGTGTHRSTVELTPAELSGKQRIDYAAAGHFVRWLIETRGVDHLNRVIDGDSVEDVFGQSGEGLVQEYNETAPWAYPAWEPCPYPEISAVADGEWEEELSFSCASEGATGAQWEGTSMVRTLSLDAGTYEFEITGGLGALVVACQMDILAEEPDPPFKSNGDIMNEAEAFQTAFGTFFDSNVKHVITVTDGVYRFAITSGVEELATVGVSVRRVQE